MVQGDSALLESPEDWENLLPCGRGQHFLFYFRDDTFECVAQKCVLEPAPHNALHRRGKTLAEPDDGTGRHSSKPGARNS